MPSPVSSKDHSGTRTSICIAFLGFYRSCRPPECRAATTERSVSTWKMSRNLTPFYVSCRGVRRSRPASMMEEYVAGAPELIAEIAVSSVSYDLHDKLRAYHRNGVREYLVWRSLGLGHRLVCASRRSI